MTDLERRKRALVAESDVYRETLRRRAYEVGLGLNATGAQARKSGLWAVGLVVAIPLLAWILRSPPKKEDPASRLPRPERPRKKGTLLNRAVKTWGAYQKYSPVILMAWRFYQQRFSRR